MRITFELPVEPVKAAEALAEIKREGKRRREIYPKLIEEGELPFATAQRRLLALADAYRIVEAVSRAVAPLVAEQAAARIECRTLPTAQ